MSLWTPALISPARWFDFSNSSSVTVSSGDISQINDLSGNAGHLSQSDNTKRPAYTASAQNGLNVGTFDGVDEFLQLASDFSLGTAHSVFIACKNSTTIAAASTFQCIASGGVYTNPLTTVSEFLFCSGSVTGTLTNERLSSLVLAHPGATIYGYGKTDADISNGFIASSAYTTSGNSFRGRLNGSNDLLTATTNGGFVSTNTRYPTILRYLGSRGGSSAFWNGQVWEMIIFSSYLSQSDTELVEGYLAWKWGVNTSLPIGHPYYSAAPTVPGRARRKINDGLFNRGLFHAGLTR